MNKNLITFENKIIKVLLKIVYKKIDVEITYQFANPYQLITKELKILKNLFSKAILALLKFI